MRYHLHTYGCQMNARDAEAVAAALESAGWQRAVGEADADLILVNTCSVRAKAEDKALGKLGLLCAGKRDVPHRIVGVLGCMVQNRQNELFERVPLLDFAVGPTRYAEVPDLASRALAGERGMLALDPDVNATTWTAAPPSSQHLKGAISAFVTILLGCNRRCSYCIVPAVRGPEYSRPANDIHREVEDLTRSGVREVVLLGQSVMRYGALQPVWAPGDQSPGGFETPFPRLLEALSALPALKRIRFTSGHPSGCTPELLRAFQTLPKICPHLHLPAQSGSDTVLKRMRRGYTRADFLDAVRRLRAAHPDMAVTTDIIVGFPGETETDFAQTRSLMVDADFDNAFLFKYSPRRGTPAAEWLDDVPEPVKQQRHALLLQDQNHRTAKRLKAQVGRDVEVLVEGPSPKNPAVWTGRSPTHTIVLFPPEASIQPGDLVIISIQRATAQALYGNPVSTVNPRDPT